MTVFGGQAIQCPPPSCAYAYFVSINNKTNKIVHQFTGETFFKRVCHEKPI